MSIPVSDVNGPSAATQQQDPQVLLREALDALPDIAVVLDAQGVIVMTNTIWRQYAMAYSAQPGMPATGSDVGMNYLQALVQDPDHDDSARQAVQGVRDVLSGHIEAFCLTYPCHTPDEQLWFTMTVTPLLWDGQPGALVTHTDTTPRHRLTPR